MTREEKKAIDGNKYYPEDVNCYYAFLHGAEWSDKHPKNVWHDAHEEPQGEYEIICQDEFEHVWLTDWREVVKQHASGWEEYAACECIVNWAYISDLFPKGGEK